MIGNMRQKTPFRGSDVTAAGGGFKGTERVAGVDNRGRRSVADDDVGHPNRAIPSFRLRNDTLIGSVRFP